MTHDPSATLHQTYPLLREACAWIDLPQSRAVRLTGEDRKNWLQGQTTNDLRDLPVGGSIATCFCSPTGQLLAVARVYDAPNALVLLTNQPEIILRRVEELVILEDVAADVLPGDLRSLQGPTASRELSANLALPAIDVAQTEDLWLFRHDRTGSGGWDVLAHAGNHPLPQAPTADETSVALAQLEAGIPLWGVDTNPKTLPPELGSAFEQEHVNYKKGCYTGQEVLMRIHSRGHTNKTWIGLLCESLPAPGDTVVLRGIPVGSIHRADHSPEFGPIASATLRNEAAQDGLLVEILSQTNPANPARAEVVRLPFLTA